MKRLFHFILSHSIFIAICALALSLQTLQLLSRPVNGYLLAFIFFAALAGYNAYWLVSKYFFNRHPSLISLLQKNRSSFFVLLAALTGIVFCMPGLHLVMCNIIITFILLVLYAMPVMPFKKLHFTRKAGYLKTLLLAFAWTMVTILIPLQNSILQMGDAELLLFINRFLFMLMLCIIFDKRDAVVDKIRGLQTMATNIQPRQLHCLMGLVFIGYAVSSYSMKIYGVSLYEIAALIIAGLATLYVYIRSLQKKGYLYYYFLVDGLMLLSALLTWVAGFL